MKLGYVMTSGKGETDDLLAAVAERLGQAGVVLGGAVQINTDRPDRSRCDMDLRVLPAGPVVRISQRLGPGAVACRLDSGALEQAGVEIARHLGGAQLVIINKFGKQEAAGRGLAPVIAEALAQGLPVLTGVTPAAHDGFLTFAAGLAEALDPDPDTVTGWCRAALGG